MSVQPTDEQGDVQLLTVEDFLALGEVEPGYAELVEGRLCMSPSTSWRHSKTAVRIHNALERQLPPELAVCVDVDVDLALVEPGQPGFVRRPDVVVATRAAEARLDREGGILRAAEVVLAVEIISVGSVRMDRVMKRGEYADAGIPSYWIVDLSAPVSLLVCHQAGELGYADSGEFTGPVRLAEPFEFEIDVSTLA